MSHKHDLVWFESTRRNHFGVTMFNVKLTQIESTHDIVRTKITEGKTYALPTVGECFQLFADPLDKSMGYRDLRTSYVQSVVEDKNGFTFKTLNSTYRVELI